MIKNGLMQVHSYYCMHFRFIIRMKLTLIMIVFAFLNAATANVYSQQKVSLDVQKTKLSRILKLIEESSDYYFVYSSTNKNLHKELSLSVENERVVDLLPKLFRRTGLQYSVSDKGLVIISEQQNLQVKGTVTDVNQNPLSGATVRVKGSNVAKATDINGQFDIDVPVGTVLVVSYTGYLSKEVTIQNSGSLTIALTADDQMLNEVVVTALGVTRERRTLGYSVTQINGETLTQARENNVANALVGKVAGLDVTSTSGGVGSATSVVIRGASSLSQTNQPLYVINGVPMENAPVGFGNTNPNGNSGSQWDNAPDFGDAIGNLNPDDIESISVLKGAAASALYGSRAKAGVILITTKSGKGTGIDFSSNYVVEQVMDRTDWQYVYGQGVNGQKPEDGRAAAQVGGSSWGAKLDGSSVPQFDGVSRPYVAQKDNIKNFYESGHTWTNSLALNKSFEGGALRFSVSDLSNKSIMPNSGLDRQSFSLVGTFEPIKRLSIDARTNYIIEKAKNRPMLSDGAGSANYNTVFLPTSVDVRDLKPWKTEDGKEIPYNTGNAWDTNPWFAAYEIQNNTNRNRLISSLSARYTFDNGLFVQGRAGQDYYTNSYISIFPEGLAYNAPNNMVSQQMKFSDINADVLIGKSFVASDDITFTPNLGASYRNTKTDLTVNQGTDFLVPGVHTITGLANKSVGYMETEQETQSVYGTLEFAYRDILYLTGSARSDWFSTLATPGLNNKLNVVYPSISGSFVFTEFLNSSALSFGKLRAGYAVVGQATNPYQTALTYRLLSQSLNGKPLGEITNTSIPNSQLKASKASELEIGTDLRFFNDRLNLDLTWYKKRSDDEITSVTTSNTVGYDGAILNSGSIQNKGIEALLTGVLIKKENFNWTSSLNMTYNENKVLSLADGVPEQLIATSRSGVGFLKNIPGEALGQIMAYDFKYDDNGNIVTLADGSPDRGELKSYGSAYNKWFAGWNNDFSYKNFNLGFLIDGKFGGKLFSATDYYGYIKGLHQATLERREELGNTAPKFYENTANNTSHRFVNDASFIKFRQLTFGYSFPAKMFNNRINGLNVSFVARNLFILMRKTDNIDPESSYNATFPGLELGGMPPARTFGLNLNVKF
ncbi:TonB-linked outer membrane protein, SusC/RagA family [Sphingobacterium wenxiniae]|uniref:TonB-linked outer membrane protein, SusC/RagA family n=2 Tax=Sphingobacterium wenxiniae TaxID=683125 RepID=A0A1I6QR58_9SPHI|nr:TonB-linked outer membrane protein, SusC/RagA family [Sphingobacterium wenxiniae]